MYTYGRNRRTHDAILILIKRVLTLLEVTEMSATNALIYLSDDEQIHPVLRANIKEAQSRATDDAHLWTLFWSKKDIFTPLLSSIMSNCSPFGVATALRGTLSLAAFEEDRLRQSLPSEERYLDEASSDDWLI